MILSDPALTGGVVVFVRFTTYKPGFHSEHLICGPNEFDELAHDSVLHYGGAIQGQASAVQAGIDDGKFDVLRPLPPITLKNILAEAVTSDFLASKHLRFIAPTDHPGCQAP